MATVISVEEARELTALDKTNPELHAKLSGLPIGQALLFDPTPQYLANTLHAVAKERSVEARLEAIDGSHTSLVVWFEER